MKRLRNNTNPETTKWVWAISEQLYMLDTYDANYIGQASSGWKDENAYKVFLENYSLTRGKHGKFLRENWRDIRRICHKHYAKELPKTDYHKCANERWHKVVAELASHPKNEKGSELFSFAMKMYWFYQPAKLPMYDQYVRASLSMHFGKKITPDDFLVKFYDFYAEKSAKIDEATNYVAREYPYRYRIADKYLWLIRPNKDESYIAQTINTLISSHQIAKPKLKGKSLK